MPKWTKEQEAAIDARECNLLISAAAGSGKTAVLVERILQLILKDGVAIDKLLVVTFTNAAAGEMRERIGSALVKAIDEGSGDNEHLRQQLNLLSKASISTLHSFCISVIRKYFHVINLDPGFRIGDQTECDLIKLEVMEDLFESEYEKESETFLGLVERFSGNKQDTNLQNLVMKLHEFVQSKPFPKKWLNERVEDFAKGKDELEASPWYRSLLNTIQMEIQGIIDGLKEASVLCKRPNGPAAYDENLSDDLRQMEHMLNHAVKNDLEAFMKAYGQVKFSRLKPCGKDVDEDLRLSARALRDEARETWKKLGGGMMTAGLDESLKQLNELYPYMQYLSGLVFKFDEAFKHQKQERGIIDFNDLEHYTLEILQHAPVAQELQQRFKYIFIDEYQDSNLVQETILSYVCREDNLFMVGDVKQSIYRFRLADPTIFLEKYETYIPREGEINRRIDLNKNFRSRSTILSAVNYLFENIMSPDLGELEYDNKAALYPGLEMPPIEKPQVELHLIEKDMDEEEEVDADTENLSDVEVEASIAAERIKQLVDTEIYYYDKSEEKYLKRKLEYRDMVVLLRTTKDRATVFQEVFALRGIPVYADINTGYFEALEVKTIVALLKLIDNKYQDIPLLTVMRSPIGGFNADDMIRIRTEAQGKAFYQATEEYIQNHEKHDDELTRRLIDFYERLVSWQKASRYLPMEEFIWKLYTETGYYYYAGAMPGGFQRQANLRILLERARQFQQTSIKGLFQFIRFIDKLKSSSGDMGVAKTLGENENVVRIMSIHKSKGLEFPVVIVAGLGKQFNFSDTNASVLFHKDLGLGPKYVNPTTRQSCETIAKTAMKQVIRLENLSEEMRILYVALTRPKDRLILLGSAANLKKNAEKWAKPVSPYYLSKGRNFLDWIGPVLMRHPDGDMLRDLLEQAFDQPLWHSESKWKVKKHSRSDVAVINKEESIKRQELLNRLQYPHEYIDSLISEKSAVENRANEQKIQLSESKKAENRDVEQETQLAESKEVDSLQNINVEDIDKLRSMIDERFSWEYPHKYAVNIPSKLTVTEISKLQGLRPVQLHDEDETQIPQLLGDSPSFSAKPKFLEDSRKFSAAEKGTIVHFILQHLDLSSEYFSKEEVKRQVDEMVRRELITLEEARAADLSRIHSFINSETGQRICNGTGVRREVPFNYRKKAYEIVDNLLPNDDTLLIQGVIDCFFEEDGQLVIVDYKTDYVDSPERVNQLKQRYQLQMDLYTEALERITGKPVKERILYLLSINQAVKL